MSTTVRRGLRQAALGIVALGVFNVAVVGHAQMVAQPASGEYIGNAGMATLNVSPGPGEARKFTLEATGGNGHQCSLDGLIRKGEARMPDSADDKKPCIVTFAPAAGGKLIVGEKHEGACRYYCGVRAQFDGAYELPSPACTRAAVAQTRKRFKTEYDKKAYAQARDLLLPVAQQCANVMSEVSINWIANDLALAQHRAGDSAACKATLQGLVELANTPDATIKTDYPPSDAEDWLKLARATRTNLGLCGAPVTIKPKARG